MRPSYHLRIVSRMSIPSRMLVVKGSTRVRSSLRMLLPFFFKKQPYAARIQPDLFSGDARRGQIALRLLCGIATGRLPYLPTEVIVHHAARGHGQVEEASREVVGAERKSALVAR